MRVPVKLSLSIPNMPPTHVQYPPAHAIIRYMRLEGGPQNTEAPIQTPSRRLSHPTTLIGGGILLFVFLLFVWRIVFFYIGIVRGTVAPPTSFVQALSVDATVQRPLGDVRVGETELATFDDPNYGADERAFVTIVEFADFGCPYSREASYVVRTLAKYTDLVRYVYRDFPIPELHPNAALAAEAGECAQEQQRFFDYHDKLYQNQSELSLAALKRYAQELGLDSTLFDSCLDSRRYTSEVEEDRQAGIAAGVRGTPTFYINGIQLEGAVPQEILVSILERYQATRALIERAPNQAN